MASGMPGTSGQRCVALLLRKEEPRPSIPRCPAKDRGASGESTCAPAGILAHIPVPIEGNYFAVVEDRREGGRHVEQILFG
jgi:hypothetical protein